MAGFQPQPYHQDPDELVVCPKCNRRDASDARFCDQCGFALTSTGFRPADYERDPDETVTCPFCGKGDDTDARFCDQCGQNLVGSAAGGASVGMDSFIRGRS